MNTDTSKVLSGGYRNWQGHIATRTIQPLMLNFGSTEFHQEPQWILEAFDVEKGEARSFALKDFDFRNPELSMESTVARGIIRQLTFCATPEEFHDVRDRAKVFMEDYVAKQRGLNPADPATLRKQMVDTVATILRRDFEYGGEVTEATHLLDDVGLDSLDSHELLICLEGVFSINLPDKPAYDAKTVGELVSLIHRLQY